jgi:hypothetical protein
MQFLQGFKRDAHRRGPVKHWFVLWGGSLIVTCVSSPERGRRPGGRGKVFGFSLTYLSPIAAINTCAVYKEARV